MKSINYMAIRNAILKKQHVVAVYHGKLRKMCPHVIGLGADGSEYALFYQFDGESSSGGLPNWRCIRISELEDLYVADGPWQTSDNHTKQQTCVKDIDLEVSY